jgi:hypothetical protein
MSPEHVFVTVRRSVTPMEIRPCREAASSAEN